MLLICVCHFSCSYIVLQVGDVLKLALLAWSRSLDLKGAFFFFLFLFFFSGVFVSSPSTCILFSSNSVPSDFYNTIQKTSYRLCCKFLCILSRLSLAVLRVTSSANKSYWTDARVRHMGKSLIKTQNRSGPRIDS